MGWQGREMGAKMTKMLAKAKQTAALAALRFTHDDTLPYLSKLMVVGQAKADATQAEHRKRKSQKQDSSHGF